jgi:beta-glucosidase
MDLNFMKQLTTTISFFLAITLFSAITALPFSSAAQSIVKQIGSKAIEAKIAKMTLAEKIDFIGGYQQFNIRGYEHLGIPEIHIADGPVGIRNFGPSTAYPASIAIAASWDKSIAYKVGQSIAMEARAHNIHLMLGPGVNIYRLPITGRNFEYMGEDPYLAGELATHYIQGMQGQRVMANTKHYVANNQEFDRNHTSSDMDERTLHEIYLPPFKASVDAGVATMMTGYNPVNGVHMSEHDHLNNKILKGDWGFSGFIVSDWVSTYDAIAAANGGLDLEMPSGAWMNQANLLPAIKSGQVKLATIDDKIRRILTTYDKFGYFTEGNLKQNFILDKHYVRNTALEAARGGMVLLKNANNVLPVKKNSIKRIAVIGPNADPVISGGGGSSFTTPLHPKSLLTAVQEIAGKNIAVSHHAGIFTGSPMPKDIWQHSPFYIYDGNKKVNGVKAEFYLGKQLSGDKLLEKTYPQVILENEQLWADNAIPKTNFSVRFTSYFTPQESSYYSLAGQGDDGYRILLDDIEVISAWRDQGPTTLKKEIFMNAGQEYKVVTEYYQAGGGALIYQGIKKAVLNSPPSAFKSESITVAKKADLVILAVGFNPQTEGEAYDRSFELPYQQSQFIKDITAEHNNVIVVLNAGGNVDMKPWIDDINALIMAWYPGQEGNQAIAEIIFGETNPSGKLPASFEVNIEDNPSYQHYFDNDNDKAVFYGEGLFMGYRYWDTAKIKPRYAFGYGLSYTQFSFEKLTADQQRYNANEKVNINVTVKNTGELAGAEVIQVYVHDKKSRLVRPEKELKAFAKVWLEKGEQKIITLSLDKAAFSYYDDESHQWLLEPGQFTILVGNASDNILLQKQIFIE